MTSQIAIAVGHRCSATSEIAVNAPYCVKIFPLGQNKQEVIVGTYFKKEFVCDSIDLMNFDKSEVISHFENFKDIVETHTNPEEFNSNQEHDKWIKDFKNASVDIVVLVVD